MTFVRLDFLCAAMKLYSLVTARPGYGYFHRFVEQIETLDFLDSVLCALRIVKYNESLALGLEILLCNNVYYISKFGEERAERIDKSIGFDALFEVLHINTIMPVSKCAACRSAMTRTC
jgi:hypothetical protein